MQDVENRVLNRAVFIIFLLAGNLFAAKVSDLTAVRAAGIGGAFTGWAGDTDAIVFNPAGLGTVEKKTLGAGYNLLSEDINQQAVNIIIPTTESGVFGLSANYLDLGNFQNRDSQGTIIKQFKRQEIKGIVSYGKKIFAITGLSPSILSTGGGIRGFIGGNLKYFNTNLTGLSSANGYSFDFGAMIKYKSRISAGVLLKDPVGVKMKDDKENEQETAIPALRAGLGIRIFESFFLAFDMENSQNGNSIAGGIEINAGRFSFRFGDNMFSKGGNTITAGLGIDLTRNMALDYAAAYLTDLDFRHSAYLTVKFGMTADELWQIEHEKLKAEQIRTEREQKIEQFLVRIKTSYENQNWENAIKGCEDALKFAPDDEKINTYYRNSREKLRESGKKKNLVEIKKALSEKKWDQVIILAENALAAEPGNEEIARHLDTAKREKGLMTIAVADITALSPVTFSDVAFMSEFLRNGIVQTKKCKVVDKNNMERILAEQGFQQTGCTDQECVIKMGRVLNVQKIVSGTCGKLGEYYVLTIKMTSVETGEILNTAKVSWTNLNPDIVDNKIQEVLATLLK